MQGGGRGAGPSLVGLALPHASRRAKVPQRQGRTSRMGTFARRDETTVAGSHGRVAWRGRTCLRRRLREVARGPDWRNSCVSDPVSRSAWIGSRPEGSSTIDTQVNAAPSHRRDARSAVHRAGSAVHHAGGLGFLALTAIGVVFGDIGTSPLYAFSIALNATGHAVPTPADVRGVVSLIFWALVLMVSVKYVQLVLRADNDGEGGILALLSLVEGDRLMTGLRISLPMMLGILGAALLYGDGVITPAISVLSAMEGLKLAAPGFQSFILPVTLVILVGLFAIQHQGTAPDRPAVRPGDGRLVPGHRRAWRGQHRRRARDRHRGQPARRAADPDRPSRHRGGGVRRHLPGADRRRGAVCRHGPCRRPGDPAGLVRPGGAGAGAELFRPGRADAGRPARGRQPVLQAGARLGAGAAHRARRGGDGDRVAGADLRACSR